MDSIDKIYIESSEKQNKRFYLVATNTFESLTLDEYNQRFETNHMSWVDVDDIDIFNADEMLYHYDEVDIKFL